jgi:tRNA A37 threonylcarbamoyladenosine synthetase subunit TsaC/SUA5/YrdC
VENRFQSLPFKCNLQRYNVVAGRQQPFKLARLCLPGPYTFILNAVGALHVESS